MKKIFKNNINLIITFFITILSFIAILVFSDIFGYGNRTILRGDLFSQYAGFIREFVRGIKGEGSLYYNFSFFYGSGTMLTYAYYALNPLNLLFLIEGINVSLTISIIIIIKIGLAGSCFYYFIDKNLRKNCNNVLTIIFSLFYALSGYVMVFHYHIMWLDALYLLPLVIHFVIKLVTRGRCLGLIITYSYLFITNFYMGYIVGVFSFVCFISYLLFIKPEKIKVISKRKVLILYIASVVLSVGICCVVLLPTALFLFNSNGSTSASFENLKASFADIYNSLFIGHAPSIDNKVPYLYCGIVSILCFPLFFLSGKISKKEKYIAGVIGTFLLLAMMIMPLYKLMHAFDYPNYYGFRFSFCVIFLILCITYRLFNSIAIFNFKIILPYSLMLIILYVVMIYTQAKKFGDINTNSYSKLLINFIAIIIWLLIIVDYKKINKKTKSMIWVLVFSVIEIVINGTICFDHIGVSETEEKVNSWTNAMENGLSNISDNDFYRVRVDGDVNFNSASMFGFNGLTSFSSSDNLKLRTALNNLGIAIGDKYIIEKGYNELSEMLFAAKYKITLEGDVPEYIGTNKNEEALSLGYLVSKSIYEYKPLENPFDNLTMLVNLMSDEKFEFFVTVDPANVKLSSRGIMINDELISGNRTFDEYENEFKLSLWDEYEGENNPIITFWTDNFNDMTPVAFLDSDVKSVTGMPLFYGKSQGKKNGNSVAYNDIVIGKPSQGGSNVFWYLYLNDCEEFKVNSITFSFLKKSEVSRAFKELSENEININIQNDDHIIFNAKTDNGKNVLFTSIPYEIGWSAYVDGEPVNIHPCVDDAFISVDLSTLEDGEHEVELIYKPVGLMTGAIITLISFIAVNFFSIVLKKNNYFCTKS